MATTPDLPPPDIGPLPNRDSSSSFVSFSRLRNAFIANRRTSFLAAISSTVGAVTVDSVGDSDGGTGSGSGDGASSVMLCCLGKYLNFDSSVLKDNKFPTPVGVCSLCGSADGRITAYISMLKCPPARHSPSHLSSPKDRSPMKSIVAAFFKSNTFSKADLWASMRQCFCFVVFCSFALFACHSLSVFAQSEATDDNSKQIEFFETDVRPLLIRRCYECHSESAEKIGGGLRLDNRASVLKGGDSGIAINSEDPNHSLLIQSVRYETNEMPPNEKLPDAEIAILEKWVSLGAPWPNDAVDALKQAKDYDWDLARTHWAFQPIQKPNPPTVQNDLRIRNDTDPFVIDALNEQKLEQSPAAPAPVFVRRAFLDLIGLPPSPEELKLWIDKLGSDEGLNDAAVSELIDTLLDRPQYGERWGRHWLDVARYSEVGGWTQDDRPHPMAWQYRDWVVKAFNADMPYDQFVRNQIVGDQLGMEQSTGTGMFALGPTYSSDGGDPESIAQAQSETLDDRVDTFSRAFLGLTVACARCHDHKFDPIPTQDYYSIAGVFNNTNEIETPLASDQVVKEYHDHQRPIQELNDRINKARQLATQENRQLSETEQAELASWTTELESLKAKAPAKYDYAHTIHDSGNQDMKVALRGNLLKPGEVAPRRFLRIVSGNEREAFSEGSGRKQLADAVVDRNNPLTARVIVNRIWLNHFGQGLVRTPDNFGKLGEPPTHPPLLDWLASTFMESGWSIKALHRTIMNSATYRSSSRFSEAAFSNDGDNRYLWRISPRRMDVETWRDSLLAVTGELNGTIGGPSIDNILVSDRRTMYAKVSRNDPLDSDEFLRLFDFPIPRASSAKRTENVIPQQFLFMMNSSFMRDRAKAFSERLNRECESRPLRIERAYLLLFGRKPTDKEMQAAETYLAANTKEASVQDQWQLYCQALMSSNEFMYIR